MNLFFLLFSTITAHATDLYVPVNIQKAFSNQTRSHDGLPPRIIWFGQRACYKIKKRRIGLKFPFLETACFSKIDNTSKSILHKSDLNWNEKGVMKRLLISIGTRGDMEPFLAIGELLKEKGHQVICAFSEQFARLAQESGQDYNLSGKKILVCPMA